MLNALFFFLPSIVNDITTAEETPAINVTRPFDGKHCAIKSRVAAFRRRPTQKTGNRSVRNHPSTDKSHFCCDRLHCAASCESVDPPSHPPSPSTAACTHGGGTGSTSRSSTMIKSERQEEKKNNNDLSYFLRPPTPPPTPASLHLAGSGGTLKKKVISFVMCDSLFASMYAGNFHNGPRQ